MGILDALFGHKDEPQANPQGQSAYGQGPYGQQQPTAGQPYGGQAGVPARPQNADEQAVARYRYMLQTAPPEELERAHAEAFGRLTPEQRRLALQNMANAIPENERHNLSDDPQSLARAATRAEIRQPGTIERVFGGTGGMGGMAGGGMMGGGIAGGGLMGGGGMGMGGMLAGSLLSSLAGSFIGSSIANSFFSHHGNEQASQSSPEAASVDGGVNDYNSTDYNPVGLDASADPYGDPADGGFDQVADNQAIGQDASADPYGDPGVADTDTGGFDTADLDTGDFDSGGFDGGGDF